MKIVNFKESFEKFISLEELYEKHGITKEEIDAMEDVELDDDEDNEI